jgi:hypothetical protein
MSRVLGIASKLFSDWLPVFGHSVTHVKSNPTLWHFWSVRLAQKIPYSCEYGANRLIVVGNSLFEFSEFFRKFLVVMKQLPEAYKRPDNFQTYLHGNVAI